MRNLNSEVSEKVEQIEKLTSELTSSQDKNTKLEENKREFQKQYENEKTQWQEERSRFERSIEEEQSRHKQRVPFDPFKSTKNRITNVIKSNGKTR